MRWLVSRYQRKLVLATSVWRKGKLFESRMKCGIENKYEILPRIEAGFYFVPDSVYGGISTYAEERNHSEDVSSILAHTFYYLIRLDHNKVVQLLLLRFFRDFTTQSQRIQQIDSIILLNMWTLRS